MDNKKDSVTIFLCGEHDLATIGPLTHMLTQIIELAQTNLIIDMSDTHFLSISTLSVIDYMKLKLDSNGQTLTIRNPTNAARHVIELCDLTHLLDR